MSTTEIIDLLQGIKDVLQEIKHLLPYPPQPAGWHGTPPHAYDYGEAARANDSAACTCLWEEVPSSARNPLDKDSGQLVHQRLNPACPVHGSRE